ncbi:MAG: hypothetical protein AMXMBFR84_36530 [Candidatus Hydrogenedentota bacterium]
MSPDAIDISFIVIGYNESRHLEACLRSIQDAHLEGWSWEIIYADGASTDGSAAIAERIGVNRVVGGEKRRRAAENRNHGAAHARGVYLHFVDGDMVLHPAWPATAAAFMADHPVAAAVCGILEEVNDGLWHQVLELDWPADEGAVESCGGCALFRRSAFEQAGGFPEDVAYGEEPYLCWRIRREQGLKIYQLPKVMAYHDLALAGFRSYWKQYVRNGRSYAEIAARCAGTDDPMWSRERRSNYIWGAIIVTILSASFFLSLWIDELFAFMALLIIVRKFVQTVRRGTSLKVALVYALHTYFAKVPLAWGQLRWWIENRRKG